MRLMPRLFVGGYRELRRPVHMVDESLMRRIEEARHQLRLEGKDVKPIRGYRIDHGQGVPSAERHSAS